MSNPNPASSQEGASNASSTMTREVAISLAKQCGATHYRKPKGAEGVEFEGDSLSKFVKMLASRFSTPSRSANAMQQWALRELLGALPVRRDWLNPDAEKVLREILSQLDAAGQAGQQAATAPAPVEERAAQGDRLAGAALRVSMAEQGYPVRDEDYVGIDGPAKAAPVPAPTTVAPYAEQWFTVEVLAQGDSENTAAQSVHHALAYANKAGFIKAWGDAEPVARA